MTKMKIVRGGFRGDVVPGGFRGDVVPGGFRGDVVPGGFRGDVVPGGFRGNRVIYRTQDNAQDYFFDVERLRNGTYRLYIERQPGYNGYSTDGHPTHRYWDGSRQQHYVCVEEGHQPDEWQLGEGVGGRDRAVLKNREKFLTNRPGAGDSN
jgi:hypothetical protein